VGRSKLRAKLGWIAVLCAVVFAVWLPLGILEVVPFVFEIPGETLLRSHAGLAVGFVDGSGLGFLGKIT
jgi:hypothetical protein